VADRPDLGRGLGVLTCRLGRRLVLLFLACALAPLAGFAWLAFAQVTRELTRQNVEGLHGAAKAAGMSLAARFGQLQVDLELVRGTLPPEGGGPHERAAALANLLRGRIAALWLVDGGSVEPLWGEAAPLPAALPADAGEHLGRSGILVQGLGRPDRLVAFARLERAGRAPRLLVAEPARPWLFDFTDLRVRGSEVLVLDGSGAVLGHTLASEPAVAPLLGAVAREPASGTVEWEVGGERHLARYWRAFLRPQYGLDLLVVQSRARAEVLEAVTGFATWFTLTAAGALLCVLVASLVQMRRTLQPIIALGEATRRVAAGDFAARAGIRTRDEFGELGLAFDRMTAELAANARQREAAEAELVASRDAALAAARAKSEFVTNVSHEFRTPMTEVQSAIEILATFGDGGSAERGEFLSVAQRGAHRLARLVDDVLQLSSADPWRLAPADLAATLRAAVARLQPAVAARVGLQLADDLPPVAAVDFRLADTWWRLLDNAAKFGSPDGAIEVRARAAAGHVVVEIADHGAGIAAADLARIFEPFGQCGRDQLVDKAPGTGLGLSIVRRTVERHRGRIEVDSEPGVGSTFRVVLPALAGAAQLLGA